MRIAPELSEANIVLLGSFDPLILRPDWFAHVGLVPEKMRAAAVVELVHAEVVVFTMEWLRVHVQRDRFQVSTSESPLVRIADLTVKVFREFLPHTPVSKLGINRHVHFSVGGETAQTSIARKLAPTQPWGEWGAQIEKDTAVDHGGLRTLIMEQRNLKDRPKGHIQARVEPSAKVKFGISMAVNDHYEVENEGKEPGAAAIVGLLESNFEGSIKRSEWIVDLVMALK